MKLLIYCLFFSQLISGYLHSQEKTLKIGVVISLTGTANTWGQASLNGLKLAEHDIESSSEFRTWQNKPDIELIVEDSKTNPTTGVTAFNKLINNDRVKIVIGDAWGFLVNAISPLALRNKVVYTSPVAFKESIGQPHEYLFSMGANTSGLLPAINHFFKLNPKIKRVGIFCWDNPWGHAYLKLWKESAKLNSVEIVQELCSLETEPDFKIETLKIKNSNVDAVFITQKTAQILRRIKELKFSPVVLTTSNMLEEFYNKEFPRELFEGVYLTDWLPNDEFITKYKNFYGYEPINQAHSSYDLLKSIYQAYLLNPNDIISGLRQVKYSGVADKIDFSNSNWGNQDHAELYSVTDGKILKKNF